jgi:hypothetical protein
MNEMTLVDLRYQRSIEKKNLNKEDIEVLKPYLDRIQEVRAFYYPIYKDDIFIGVSAKSMARMGDGLITSVRLYLDTGEQIAISQRISFGEIISYTMDVLEVNNFEYMVFDCNGKGLTDSYPSNSVKEALDYCFEEVIKK